MSGVDLATVRMRLRRNRHLVAVLGVVLLAVWIFPGEPAPIVETSDVPSAGADVIAAPSPGTSGVAPPTTTAPTSIDGGVTPTEGPDRPPLGPPAIPPPADEDPAPTCSTDALVDTYALVAGPLGEALGSEPPEKSLRDLAAIAVGCSDANPTGPFINLMLETASLLPDLGIDPIDLPDVPALPTVPIPPEVVAALGPLAAPIQEACANIALIALLLAVLPPAAQLPVGGSDLAALTRPASAVCAAFDEGPPS